VPTVRTPLVAGASRGSVRTRAPGTLLALAAWAGLIVAARLLIEPLNEADPRIHVGNPPLVGVLDPSTTWRLGAAIVLAVAAVVIGPQLARDAPWRAVLGLAGIAAFAFAVLLAGSDGLHHVADPLETRYEYLHDVPRVSSTPDFLGTFADLAPTYVFHVHAHPPGALLFYWALDRVGLDGGWPAALATIGIGSAAVPAALVAAREVGSEAAARAAAPFLAFAPAAVWIATSADAMYMGVAAIGIALFALASGRPGDAGGDGLAFLAGLVLGAALFVSYGVTTLGVIVLAIAVYRRALRPLLFAAGGVLAVVLAFLAGGFWWYEGLQAARELQLAGVYQRRPYGEFLVNGPASFALVVGPAIAVALVRLRGRGLWVLVGAALFGLLFANVSGFARGETERVWLQFAPWVLLAAGAFAASSLRERQAWLALQLATAIGIQVAAKSPW
jgi:hypothetical protein